MSENRVRNIKLSSLQSTITLLKQVLGGAFIVILILLFVNIYFNSSIKYFYVTQTGQVLPLDEKPLSLTTDLAYSFVDDVITTTFSFSYRNIEYHLGRISYLYTPGGIKSLKKEFQDSNYFTYIKKRNVTQIAEPTSSVFKIIGAGDGTFNVFKSYAVEEVTNEERTTREVVYNVKIKQIDNGKYFYKLAAESVKEMSMQQYIYKFGTK